jgi:beclin 1
MGSFSRIERTSGDKASYELHGSGDLALGRLLHNRRFDLGMVAFLDCLRQLGEHVRSQDSGVELPHAYVVLLLRNVYHCAHAVQDFEG